MERGKDRCRNKFGMTSKGAGFPIEAFGNDTYWGTTRVKEIATLHALGVSLAMTVSLGAGMTPTGALPR